MIICARIRHWGKCGRLHLEIPRLVFILSFFLLLQYFWPPGGSFFSLSRDFTVTLPRSLQSFALWEMPDSNQGTTASVILSAFNVPPHLHKPPHLKMLFSSFVYIAKYLSRVYSKLLKCSNANNELTFFETGHDGYTNSCNFTIEKYNLFLLVDQTFVGELFYYTVLLHF